MASLVKEADDMVIVATQTLNADTFRAAKLLQNRAKRKIERDKNEDIKKQMENVK